MAFQLHPQIYALLICSAAEPDPETGGWQLKPFSHVMVPRLPVTVQLLIAVEIMGPPGSYTLQIRIFPADAPTTALALPDRDFLVQEDKNFEFLLDVNTQFTQTGLHLVQAEVVGYHRLFSPLRVSAAQNNRV